MQLVREKAFRIVLCSSCKMCHIEKEKCAACSWHCKRLVPSNSLSLRHSAQAGADSCDLRDHISASEMSEAMSWRSQVCMKRFIEFLMHKVEPCESGGLALISCIVSGPCCVLQAARSRQFVHFAAYELFSLTASLFRSFCDT